ncbi:hypothetical protein K503DRAFT_775799 [Rhizopogon vinicolor AM-OR11-026]|uniref:Uncharacterized protein n=1 Tax=Rhizopogon vinicolor AM-OR11-026 TaxID=1314800 RepID=A0A1B7MKY8_9AGAM|nr:hypothetical protein K503DRAFT_775799 [Rhizopogon vinicolor AM-OR11-026]
MTAPRCSTVLFTVLLSSGISCLLLGLLLFLLFRSLTLFSASLPPAVTLIVSFALTVVTAALAVKAEFPPFFTVRHSKS